jgi:hypothetical protein
MGGDDNEDGMEDCLEIESAVVQQVMVIVIKKYFMKVATIVLYLILY